MSLDFYEKTVNCLQIDLGELLRKGFDNGHGYIRPPKRIGSATALTAIILQSNQNDMYGGQCQRYTEPIYVEKDGILQIKQMGELATNYEAHNVVSLNTTTGKPEIKPIIAGHTIHLAPDNNLLSIELSNGRMITATLQHPLYSIDGSGQIIEIYPGDLKPGMMLAIPRKLDLIPNELSNIDNFVITEDFCKLLGLYAGDGCYSNREDTVRIPVYNQDDYVYMQSLIKELGYGELAPEFKDGEARFCFGGSKLAKFISKHVGAKSHTRRIPGFILTGPESWCKAFLEGYSRTDVYTSTDNRLSFCTASEELAMNLLFILHRLGAVGIKRVKQRESTNYSDNPRDIHTVEIPKAYLSLTGLEYEGSRRPKHESLQYLLPLIKDFFHGNYTKYCTTRPHHIVTVGHLHKLKCDIDAILSNPENDNLLLNSRRLLSLSISDRKQRQLQALYALANAVEIAMNVALVPIESIEVLPDRTVYDITVADNHNFLSGDCVWAHNSIDKFDTYLAPYVPADYVQALENTNNPDIPRAKDRVKAIRDEVYQAMEGLVYNLNSMHSRAGAQVPFSSINFGCDTTPQGRLISEMLLRAFDAGLGKGEPPLFPNLVFRLKQGINMDPSDPNYDLFQLSCRVSAKQMNPTYSFMDSSFNKKFGLETSYMGCVDKDEVVIYRKDNEIKMESIQKLHEKMKSIFGTTKEGYTEYVDVEGYEIHNVVYGFVPLRRTLVNPDRLNWYQVRLNNGRCIEVTSDHRWPIIDKGVILTEDLRVGDKVVAYWKAPSNSGRKPKEGEDISNALNWNPEDRSQLLFSLVKTDSNQLEASYTGQSKELALQILGLAQSLGYNAKYYHKDGNYYITSFSLGGEGDPDEIMEIYSITPIVSYGTKESYCVTTDTGYMMCSFIHIGQCRTRVMANLNGPEVAAGRGNIGFVTMNLPRCAIEAKGSWPKFYKNLDKLLKICEEQLLHRYETVSKLRVKDLPFLMGQGLYVDSKDLGPDDSIEPAIKNGTLSIGYIGLAETMTLLEGKHHGESPEVYEKALEVARYISDAVDEMAKQHHLNFTTLATPAEGLSGRFVTIDKSKYGIIPGVTDKDYYVNSFHIPPNYDISLARKIELEGPFHKYTNAGHISYVELKSPPVNNPEAVEQLILYGAQSDMGYMGINFPIDYCGECGYRDIINDNCPICGNSNITRVRRITGYLSSVDRFGDGKKAELRDRKVHTNQ